MQKHHKQRLGAFAVAAFFGVVGIASFSRDLDETYYSMDNAEGEAAHCFSVAVDRSEEAVVSPVSCNEIPAGIPVQTLALNY